jgi:Zn-finger nucleic acid-binding protein
MKCPNDDNLLVMTDRQGIEIDYCPQCRGVWLDRGELDKIIDRSSDAAPSAATHAPGISQPRPREEHYRPEHKEYRHDDDHHKKRKKEGFLGDLFDF